MGGKSLEFGVDLEGKAFITVNSKIIQLFLRDVSIWVNYIRVSLPVTASLLGFERRECSNTWLVWT